MARRNGAIDLYNCRYRGIEPNTNDVILSQMREQAELAIETADVIMFLVDAREGITTSDREVAKC